MKKPSNPPSKPLTAKRKKVLDVAMAQLKKTRAQMDPSILKKIRSIIEGNPKIMKGLGIDKMPEDKVLVQREPVEKPARAKPKVVDDTAKGYEKIDQAKNMDVIAKLMALKPSEIENIKAVLLKSKD